MLNIFIIIFNTKHVLARWRGQCIYKMTLSLSFLDHVPSIWRQTGSIAWHAHQHPICHQRPAAVQAFPGTVAWHHLCLWLPRDVQTGTIQDLTLISPNHVAAVTLFWCFYFLFSRPWKSSGTLAMPMPTYPNALFLLSCSPSQSWFLMHKVSLCRWTDCQVAMRSVLSLIHECRHYKNRNNIHILWGCEHCSLF